MSEKRRIGRLPLALYLAAAAVWVVLCAAKLCGDQVARMRGQMQQENKDITQAELRSLAPWGEDWFAETPDPQIIWQVPENERVRTVTLWGDFAIPYGEMTLYYTTSPEESFSTAKKVYATENGDGSYSFLLPKSHVRALRLDPCSVMCVVKNIRVEWNTPCALWRYFCPDGVQIFWMVLLPGLTASAICLLREAWQEAKKLTQK